MIIKICGMREPDNIRNVAKTGVTWMGMIFWPKSSRYVSDLSAADAIPEGITRVGVFVNQPNEEIVRIANRCRLNIIQLHGSESVADIMALRKMLPEDTKVMKAISVSDANDVKKADSYADVVDILLFDTKCQTVGGSGKQFDWSVLDGYNGVLPFLLSGGIGPDDAERLASFHHPKMIGIDLNSRFETAPGIKAAAPLASFIKEVSSHPTSPTPTYKKKENYE